MTEISDVKIRCGHCRAVFTGDQSFADLESLQAAITAGLHETCPSCGQVVTCTEKNTRWRNSDGSDGGYAA